MPDAFGEGRFQDFHFLSYSTDGNSAKQGWRFARSHVISFTKFSLAIVVQPVVGRSTPRRI